jgi:CheY-like chemotaxis protein
MKTLLCPACQSINSPLAPRCAACGAALGDDDTAPMSLQHVGHGAAGPGEPVSALWLDDIDRPPLAARPRPGRAPVMPGVTVREIHLPAALDAARMAGLAELPVPAPAPVAAGADARPVEPAARAAHKIARRAAVRRARLVTTPRPALTDVLVYDSDDSARHLLCSLLLGFGFGVRSAQSVVEAAALAATQGFVAAFVDIGAGGVNDAVLELSGRLRGASRDASVAPPLLVLVAAQLRPLDRVRADLAGCSTILPKPVSRSSVARVLDVAGIALPSDARHA